MKCNGVALGKGNDECVEGRLSQLLGKHLAQMPTLAEKVRENVGRENTEVAMKRAKGPTYVCSSEVVLHWEEAMIE